MGRLTLHYSDILSDKSAGMCVSCDEPIDTSDGDKYVTIGFNPPQKFHVTCFMDFIMGLLEFERIFLVEKQQEKVRRVH